MTTLLEIQSSVWMQSLGWALLHALWQIAAVAVALVVVLALMRRSSANLRYLAACVGLLAAVLLPIGTYCLLCRRAVPEVSSSEALPDRRPQTHPQAPQQTAERSDAAVGSGDPRPDGLAGPEEPHIKSTAPRPPRAVLSDDGAFATVPHRRGEGAYAASALFEPSSGHRASPSLLPRVAQRLSAWMPWCAMAWLFGVSLLSAWNLGGWMVVQRLKRLGTTSAGKELTACVMRLARQMGLNRSVRILQSRLVDVPVVLGWLRPVVLVPVGILTGLPPLQLDAMLAHELAHIRRHDYLVNLLQTVAETLLFFHPGIWWISRRIRIEREYCCDDAAVAAGGSQIDYARALTAWEQRRAAPAFAVALTGGGGWTALARVRRLLGLPERESRRWRHSLVGGLAVLVLVCTVIGYVALAGESERSPVERPETESAKRAENPAAPIEPSNYALAGKTLTVIGRAEDIAVSEDGRRAWACMGLAKKTLCEIDAKTGKILGRYRERKENPEKILCRKNSLYRITELHEPARNPRVLICDIKPTLAPRGQILLGDWRPYRTSSACLSGDGLSLWLASEPNESSFYGQVEPALFRVDLKNESVIRLLGPPQNKHEKAGQRQKTRAPIHVCRDEAGGICVADPAVPAVRLFACGKAEQSGMLRLDFRPTLGPRRVRRYLPLCHGKAGAVVDTKALRIVSRFRLPGEATAMCVDAAGTTAFIATRRSSDVLVIDAATGTLRGRLDLSRPGGDPDIRDAHRGKSTHDIVALRWAGKPDRLLALAGGGGLFVVATLRRSAGKPVGGHTAKGGSRAKDFGDAVDSFRLSIWYRGREAKKHYHAALHVPAAAPRDASPFGGAGHDRNDEVHWPARINKSQAAKIIKRLLADGFLDRARNVHGHRREPCSFPGVVLLAEGPDRVKLIEEIRPPDAALKRVEGLRALLDGKAVEATDKFLGRLREAPAASICDDFDLGLVVSATVSHAPKGDFRSKDTTSFATRNPDLIGELVNLLKQLPASGSVPKKFPGDIEQRRIELKSDDGRIRRLTMFGERLRSPRTEGGSFYGKAEHADVEKRLGELVRSRFNPRKIDTGHGAVYSVGDWRYDFIRFFLRSLRIRNEGQLYFKGRAVPYIADPGDYFVTPWGRIYWHGSQHAGGWLPYLVPKIQEGKKLGPTVPAAIAQRLRESPEEFSLWLQYQGPDREEYASLRLSVTPINAGTPKPGWFLAEITAEQAEKVIDGLAKLEFFGGVDPRLAGIKRAGGVGYTIGIRGGSRRLVQLRRNLGSNAPLLVKLAALRKLFDGKAAKAMDRMLAKLKAQPEDPGSFAPPEAPHDEIPAKHGSNGEAAAAGNEYRPAYHWPLDDEDLLDRVGEVQGRIVGNVTFEDGILGKAAAIKDHSTRIDIQSPQLCLNGWEQITLSMWCKMTGHSTYGRVLSRAQGNESCGLALHLGGNAGAWVAGGFYVFLEDGSYLLIRPDTFRKNVKPHPKVGEWYHLVGTYDGKRLRFYVNGQPDGQQLAATPNLRIRDLPRARLVIGRAAPSPKYNYWHDTYFPGLVDEVTIWKRALSPRDVKLLYEQTRRKAAAAGGKKAFRLIWRETSGTAIDKVQTPRGFTISPAKAVRPIMARSTRPPWAEFYLFTCATKYYFGNTRKGTKLSAPKPGHWIIDGKTGETTQAKMAGTE